MRMLTCETRHVCLRWWDPGPYLSNQRPRSVMCSSYQGLAVRLPLCPGLLIEAAAPPLSCHLSQNGYSLGFHSLPQSSCFSLLLWRHNHSRRVWAGMYNRRFCISPEEELLKNGGFMRGSEDIQLGWLLFSRP